VSYEVQARSPGRNHCSPQWLPRPEFLGCCFQRSLLEKYSMSTGIARLISVDIIDEDKLPHTLPRDCTVKAGSELGLLRLLVPATTNQPPAASCTLSRPEQTALSDA